MMGMGMPETCWAVFKRQAINLRSCCILLVDSVENSLLCSQEPANCPYRQPEQSSPCLDLPRGLFTSGIPTKPCMHTSCPMPCPSNSSWFDHLDNIWRGIQIMKIINVQFLKFVTLPVIWLILLFLGHKLI